LLPFSGVNQEANMNLPVLSNEPDKKDYLVALVLTILALATYIRTLAPDILYSDSAEFQCLTYTLGITHSTGYPTYLFLGRLLGFLPIGNPAWRVSLFSAVCAAITVGGVYLLARYFTRSKVGAALGGVALGISYTFWAQAVIAEVYTPGLAFVAAIMLLLFHWQTAPGKRDASLLGAALLAGIGFGVHAFVWLVAPAAIALVLWTLWWQRATRPEWIRSLLAAFIGAVVGLFICLAAFLISDQLNPPTSFIRTSLEPSRIFWNLQADDFDSPFDRLKITVFSAQWGDALFPEDDDFSLKKELKNFGEQLTQIEFPPLVVGLAFAGLIVMLITQPLRGVFYLLNFLPSAFFILNYQVEDKNIFFLSLYIPLAIAAGTGIGFVLDWVHRHLESVPASGYRLLYLFPVLFFVTLVVQPAADTRWRALRSGVADFVTDDYPFPVKNLEEPRLVAQMRLAGSADNAVFVLDWRGLFATAYLAHVERGMTNTLFFESMPHGNDGKVAPTLVAELKSYVQQGRPVFTDQKYPGLEKTFRLLPASGDLYKLSLRN
jgi:transmembrane protein TMEM260 (protein O-mannosyltransferase)